MPIDFEAVAVHLGDSEGAPSSSSCSSISSVDPISPNELSRKDKIDVRPLRRVFSALVLPDSLAGTSPSSVSPAQVSLLEDTDPSNVENFDV